MRRVWVKAPWISAACAIGLVFAIAIQSATAGGRPIAKHRVALRLVHHVALFRRPVRSRHSAHEAALAAGGSVSENPMVQQMSSSSDPDNQRYLLDMAATEYVAGGDTGVWVVPGSNGACVVTETTDTSGPLAGKSVDSGSCETTAAIMNEGLIAFVGEYGGAHRIFGLVPDGNTTVTLNFADGTAEEVPVTNNVVDAAIPSVPSSFGLKDASGAARTVQP